MKFIKCLKPAITVLIAFYINRFFDFSTLFSFIPLDKKIEVNIVIYTTILNILIDMLLKLIPQKSLEITAYKKGQEPDITCVPEIFLNKKSNIAEVKLEFKIEAKIDNLKKMKLVLNLPNWVQPQSNIPQRPDGSYEYEISALTGINSSTTIVRTTFSKKIPLIGTGNMNDSGKDMEVILKIKKPFYYMTPFYKIKSNSFKLKIS